MSSSCPIVVRGLLEGEISGPSLHVTKSGKVAGRVRVAEIHSEGVLSGEFDADAVALFGEVRDKTVVRTRSMKMKLVPQKGRMEAVFCECDPAVGDVLGTEASIDAVTSTTDNGVAGNGQSSVGEAGSSEEAGEAIDAQASGGAQADIVRGRKRKRKTA